MSEEYRPLEIGEVIKEGDYQFVFKSGWVPIAESDIGLLVGEWIKCCRPYCGTKL